MPEGQIIARQGEIGVQARTLRGHRGQVYTLDKINRLSSICQEGGNLRDVHKIIKRN
jgi:hypothetical protein